MAYTPVPWHIERMRDGSGHEMLSVVKEVKRGLWQEVCRSYDTDNESLANAYLLAAAPELLEALEGMFLLTETLAGLCDSIDILRYGGYDAAIKARAAIAKAKGE